MPHLQVRLGFRNSTDQQLVVIAASVLAGMKDNKNFPDPPVPLSSVETALGEFTRAIAVQGEGGPAATADKRNKRDALMVLLRRLAHYVEANCRNDLSILLSSGFMARNPSRTRTPLLVPAITAIGHGRTTQLLLRVRAIANARCYEVSAAAHAANGSRGSG